MRTSPRLAAVIVCGLLMVACTGDSNEGPSPSIAESTPVPSPTPTISPTPSGPPTSTSTPSLTPSPTSTPSPAASATPTSAGPDWTPPDPITDDYAQRVMQELFNADVASSRIILAQAESGSFEDTEELRASIAVTRSTTAAADRLGTILGGDPSQVMGGWSDPPAAWLASSTAVVDASEGCLRVEATVDPSPLIPSASPTDFQYRLKREDGNATGWRIESQNTPEPGVSAC